MTASKKITLFNPEPTQVVYDEEGHTLGSIERVTLDELNPVAQRAVDSGLLVEEEAAGKPGKSASGRAASGGTKSAEKTDDSPGVSTQGKAD